jgi:hypothetical protein
MASGFDIQVNPTALREFAATVRNSMAPVSRACGQVGGSLSAAADREQSVPGGLADVIVRFGAVWDVEMEYVGQDGLSLASVFDGVADAWQQLDSELAAKLGG